MFQKCRNVLNVLIAIAKKLKFSLLQICTLFSLTVKTMVCDPASRLPLASGRIHLSAEFYMKYYSDEKKILSESCGFLFTGIRRVDPGASADSRSTSLPIGPGR